MTRAAGALFPKGQRSTSRKGPVAALTGGEGGALDDSDDDDDDDEEFTGADGMVEAGRCLFSFPLSARPRLKMCISSVLVHIGL